MTSCRRDRGWAERSSRGEYIASSCVTSDLEGVAESQLPPISINCSIKLTSYPI